MPHEWQNDQASSDSRQNILIGNSGIPLGQRLTELFLCLKSTMSKSSVKETIAQAKEMGLELSSEGKSWVPVEELVVKLNPDKHKQVRISVNNDEGDSHLHPYSITIHSNTCNRNSWFPNCICLPILLS